MSSKNFLHIHSTYSLHDSPQTPEDIVTRVKELGGENVTLTDHGTLLGIEPFMDAGKKHQVNTIPGVEAYTKDRQHLIIIAKNYKGYQAISYAMRDANLNLIKPKKSKLSYPVMNDDVIEHYFKNNQNVIATSACVQGPVSVILLRNYKLQEKYDKISKKCEALKEGAKQWQVLNKKFQDIRDEISELKKDRTAQKKYCSAAFQKKLEKAKFILEKMDTDDEKYEKRYKEYEYNVSIHQAAKDAVKKMEEKISFLEGQKNAVKNERDHYTKDKDKYKKEQLKLKEFVFTPEDELWEEAKERLMFFKSVFPNFYIELQYHGLGMEEYVMPLLVKLARETNTPVIAANDAHIARNTENDFEARRILRYNYFMNAQVTSDADKMLYIKDDNELSSSLQKILPEDVVKEAMSNLSVLSTCKVIMPEEKHYPSVQSDLSFDELLKKEKERRIAAGEWDQEHEERLAHEVNIIKTMGYVDYHMVVRDFCYMIKKLGVVPSDRVSEIPDDFNKVDEWLKKQNFREGIGKSPGRGSAAGSLVCNMLGITDIDPLKYNLLFERFLNPERVSMPDIDTDVKTSIRPVLIKYLQWKYGEKAVCSIATEMTYGAKAAVEMVGRDRASQLYKGDKEKKQEYLHKYTYVITSYIPDVPGTTLKSAEEVVLPKIQNDEEMMLLWNRAKLIEGRLSGTSIHAGGVIISDNDNINDYIPLAWVEEKQVWAAQCNMIKAEEKGLLKMDLLGLRTLDIETDAVHLIKKYRGISVDLDNLPFEDEVFSEIFAKGDTTSVFQFESPGMKNMLRQFKPTSFEDLILLVAAYRPGPMEYLDSMIIPVKRGEKPLSYKVPELESILSTTYGAVVYQEQVMEIFQKLAGYSLGGADLVRRAMSKKKSEKLAIEKPAFVYGDKSRGIDGCVARGIPEDKAIELFDEMMDFAKYAFNKSHAAVYALVAYQTAWLKYHYPQEFLCSMFNNEDLNSYEPLYDVCRDYGIQILPPDINHSYYNFVVENNCIRYGFKGIKGVGQANEPLLQDIIRMRKDGYYVDIKDLLLRCYALCGEGEKLSDKLSKKLLCSLVLSGAFDSLTYNRKSLTEAVLKIYDSMINEDYEYFKKQLIAFFIPHSTKNTAYNIQQDMQFCKTVLSENPLSDYGHEKSYGCTSISDLTPGNHFIMGFIYEVEEKLSKKNKPMLFIKIQTPHGNFTCIAMNSVLTIAKQFIKANANAVAKFYGCYTEKGGFFLNSMSVLQKTMKRFYIAVRSKDEIALVNQCIQKENEDKYIPLTICCYCILQDKALVQTEKPVLKSIFVSDSEFYALKKVGLTPTKLQ